MAGPNPGGEQMMLVYEHKTKGRKLVHNGLAIMDEFSLVMLVSANPDIRMLTKVITPGSTSVDIFKSDLLHENEKHTTASESNKDEVPWKVFLGHELEGHGFNTLVILTPETVAKPPGECSAQ